MSERDTSDQGGEIQDHESPAEEDARAVDTATRGLLRLGLGIVGFVLLLFALGQAFGLDLLGELRAFLGTQTGQWLTVAFFALVLIIIAMRGWRTRRRPTT